MSATPTKTAKRRLIRDFKRLQSDPPDGINAAPKVFIPFLFVCLFYLFSLSFFLLLLQGL
jgi:hypothetical protein